MKIVKLIKIALVFLTSTFAFGQVSEIKNNEKFEYSETGLNDFVVTEIQNKKKEDIYDKTLNWVKETYKNPDIVLKMQILNEKIRIDAIATNLASINNNKTKFNINYIVEITFKDNKYKFGIVSLIVQNVKDLKTMQNFKTDKKIIKYWGNTPNDIEVYFNNLNDNLKKYISETKKEEW
ncbi:DUF4468 domain-containing protein [Flavobacterium sp. ZT3R25]|uniref:DUF4468 domain-containing protein n=1 Tax=Flavobacterium galactosi TaxID=3398735 RepID=UPI003A8AECFA